MYLYHGSDLVVKKNIVEINIRNRFPRGSRSLFAIAELLVELIIINSTSLCCRFQFLEFFTKIMNSILVTHYCLFDVIYLVCFKAV